MRFPLPQSKLTTVVVCLALNACSNSSSQSSQTTQTQCGGVEHDGQCFRVCDDTKCQPGNRCFVSESRPEGFCAIVCQALNECPVGYTCEIGNLPAQDNAGLRFCKSLGLASDGKLDTPCSSNNQCDTNHGLVCAVGRCSHRQLDAPCSGNEQCDQSLGLVCSSGVCTDGRLDAPCRDSSQCSEAHGLVCGAGLCSDRSIGRTCNDSSQCDGSQGLQCIGSKCSIACSSVEYGCPEGQQCHSVDVQTSGNPRGQCAAKHPDSGPGQYGTLCLAGDAGVCDTAHGFTCVDSKSGAPYCSKQDGCAEDQDCPPGYWCGSIRSWIDDENVDFAKRPRACLKRGFCAPCKSDVDCSLQTNAVCVPDKYGERFCSLPCDPATNSCVIGARCEDVGGLTACRPDVGLCHDANPAGCSPCRADIDCGDDSICVSGRFGYKPAMNWCMPPCGPQDSFGKKTCPLAPNGREMVCLDQLQTSLGGPFTESNSPNYFRDHCYAPLTFDNTEVLAPADPPNLSCGNFVREASEECDDGNLDDTDGCDTSCHVTPECTFNIAEPNGDWPTQQPTLDPPPKHIPIKTNYDPVMSHVVSTNRCWTFKVVGAIDSPADVDTVAFMLPEGEDALVETYTDSPGKCTADLVAEARAWGNAETTADLGLVNLEFACSDLSDETMNLSDNSLCPSGHLACGDCSKAGKCGACDDDNGIMACAQLLVSTSTELTVADEDGNPLSFPIDFDGKYKMLRVYARSPQSLVPSYSVIVSRFTARSHDSSETPAGYSCY